MSMSRKDYQRIAGIFARYYGGHGYDSIILRIAKDFAEYAAEDNTEFDADRFLRAVEGNQQVRTR